MRRRVLVSYLNVLIGHGADYASAQFSDTGEQLRTGLHLSQAVSRNDYVFLMIDSRQAVPLMTTDNDITLFNSEVEFDAPVTSGNYKIYRTAHVISRDITVRLLTN